MQMERELFISNVLVSYGLQVITYNVMYNR